jgi:chemotaxis protein CheD
MGQVTVDISDMKLSHNLEEVLVTYALGSCLGVAIYDPVARVAGLIHCMLPHSKIDPAKAQANPFMFVDTGIPALFERAYGLGARKERVIVKAAGCAQILDDQGHFKIGERNYTMLRKILWKNNVLIQHEDVGGSCSRTMYLQVATGRVSLRINGTTQDL